MRTKEELEKFDKALDNLMTEITASAEVHRQHILEQQMDEAEAFAYIENTINAADVVFGVWADPSHASGYDWLAIKGTQLFLTAVGDAKTTAVPCANREHAVALHGRFETAFWQ